MNRIIIRLSGGMVQDVYTNMNEKIEVDILDEDMNYVLAEDLDEKEEENDRLEEDVKLMRAIF